MKTINITNIKIKDFSISEDDGKYTIGVIYSSLDDTGNEYNQKRVELHDGDFTPTEKTKIGQVLSALAVKIKTLENI